MRKIEHDSAEIWIRAQDAYEQSTVTTTNID